MKRPGRVLKLALESLFKKPATILYPFEPARMPEKFRGRIKFDPGKCGGCKLCMKDCPAGAIEITKVADKTYSAVIDSARCIYCAQCVDSCNKDALESTGTFELAGFCRADLKNVFMPLPSAKPPEEKHDAPPPNPDGPPG